MHLTFPYKSVGWRMEFGVTRSDTEERSREQRVVVGQDPLRCSWSPGCADTAPPGDAQPPPEPRGLPSPGRRLKVSFDSHTLHKAGS